MRLMLGKNSPELLVDIGHKYSPTHFDFHVINGQWDGTYYNGHITVHNCPGGDYSNLDKVDILCDNQDQLWGVSWDDYQAVFNNFDN